MNHTENVGDFLFFVKDKLRQVIERLKGLSDSNKKVCFSCLILHWI